ncbi:MAG: site-2 protease family protein [bacterium]|nr:MAG: site-2 protease family protein [bacterium]
MSPDRIANFIVSIVPFLLAITVHEVAHGYMAYRKGDYTAKLMGRISMNPIRHLDPVGSVLFPLLLLLSGTGVIFGWAKPVPVNAFNFRSPRKDMVLVSFAGPLSNFLLATLLAVIFKLLLLFPGPDVLWSSKFLQPLTAMIVMGMKISIYLGVFNLLPVHPLDGSHIMEGLLPHRQSMVYSRMAPYGWIILVVLLFTGLLHTIVGPLYTLIFMSITKILGI